MPVQFSLDPHWLLYYLVAFARAMGFVLVALPFALPVVPKTVQGAFGVAVGLGTEPLVARLHLAFPTTGGLIFELAAQLLIGALLGYMGMLFVSVGSAAGSLVGVFGGFATPPALDPLSYNQTPITGEFYNLIWIVLFFVSGADVAVLHGYFLSFSTGVLGHLAFNLHMVVTAVTLLFGAALEIASPVLAVMFFSQVVVGILVKVAPQLYALTFIFPLQILLSFVLMVLSMSVLPHLFDASMRDLLAAERDLLGG